MSSPINILIVGIGNTLRGDDGIGAYICSCFDQLHIDGVKTMLTQQLHTEMVDELLCYDHIVFADASITGEPVDFYPLKKEEVVPVSSSHHVNAVLLNALAKQLYQKDLPIMICSVSGENFEMGEGLSATAKKNADNAIDIICNWIRGKCR
ncbi:MAG: hydrogenase maturation protease [Chitinophagaceae bacterium]|nr:hydrogenase maturation protease [Chitinophagaceae bacterium]